MHQWEVDLFLAVAEGPRTKLTLAGLQNTGQDGPLCSGGWKGGEVRLVGYGEFSGSVWPWKTWPPGLQ